MDHILTGIDIGGTKIEICYFSPDPKTGEPLVHLRERVSTIDDNKDSEDKYQSIILKVSELVKTSSEKLNVSVNKIGIGHPGVHDPKNNLIKNSNTVALNNKPLSKDLTEILKPLGIETVLFENDANCFALAESTFGSGKIAKSVFGVILGTGVGGGIVLNNKIIAGSNGIAGEWGHLTIWDQGPKCYCGKSGCIETLISGPALEKLYFNLSGTRRPITEIATRCTIDLAARTTMARLFYWLGKGLSHVINIFDPQCIILGGGLSNIQELYQKDQSHISRWVFNNDFSTPILKASLGDSAGVFGAGLLLQ